MDGIGATRHARPILDGDATVRNYTLYCIPEYDFSVPYYAMNCDLPCPLSMRVCQLHYYQARQELEWEKKRPSQWRVCLRLS